MIDIEEKIYSDAFEDGVNHAVQKLFTSDEDLQKYGNKIDTSDITKRDYFPKTLGIGFGRIGGAKAGSRAMKRAIERGESDEEVEKRGKRAALIRAGVGTGIAAIPGAVVIAAGKTLKRLGERVENKFIKISSEELGRLKDIHMPTSLKVLGAAPLAIGGITAAIGSRRDTKDRANELLARRENLINKVKSEK